jgi:hypothetical protein
MVNEVYVTGVYLSLKCTLWARGEVMNMNHLLTYKTLLVGFYKILQGCYTANGVVASGKTIA